MLELEKKIAVKIAAKVRGIPLDAPKEKWALGGAIEILCTYTLYGFKKSENELQKKVKQAMQTNF